MSMVSVDSRNGTQAPRAFSDRRLMQRPSVVRDEFTATASCEATHGSERWVLHSHNDPTGMKPIAHRPYLPTCALCSRFQDALATGEVHE